jgi:hypothetical protein
VEYEVLDPGIGARQADDRPPALGFESMLAITEEDYRNRLRILESFVWERRLSDLWLDCTEPKKALLRARTQKNEWTDPGLLPLTPLPLEPDPVSGLAAMNRPAARRELGLLAARAR